MNGTGGGNMPTLPLAVDIAEVVAKATDSPAPLDVDAAADALLKAHPEAQVSREAVAEALRVEAEDAGVLE
jgi:hypothetical protein